MYLITSQMNINRLGNLLNAALGLFDDPSMSPLVDDAVSVKKGEQNSVYKLAIPGHSKDDVRLAIKGDKLKIYLKDNLVKSLFLTSSINKDLIKSTVKHGVLEIDFTKALEMDEEEIKIE